MELRESVNLNTMTKDLKDFYIWLLKMTSGVYNGSIYYEALEVLEEYFKKEGINE